MLPAALREAGDEAIDQYISDKLEEFGIAVEFSSAGRDPLRKVLFLEIMRMSIDPRVSERDVRARSGAMLAGAKVLGLDRDVQRFDIDATSVEIALKKLKESVDRGENAAGRVISTRIPKAPEPLPS
jgi:hypothetical protein|tara:strand:- start:2479 stop:2859 length:381 start_codon:yes stop_codon:yes gene_type:complete